MGPACAIASPICTKFHSNTMNPSVVNTKCMTTFVFDRGTVGLSKHMHGTYVAYVSNRLNLVHAFKTLSGPFMGTDTRYSYVWH